MEKIIDKFYGKLRKSGVDAGLDLSILLGFGTFSVESLIDGNLGTSTASTDVRAAVSGDS